MLQRWPGSPVECRGPRAVAASERDGGQPRGAWARTSWEAIAALHLLPVAASWCGPGGCHQVLLGLGAGVCAVRREPRTEQRLAA